MTAISSRSILSTTPQSHVDQLAAALGSDVEVTTRALERFALAVDASHYLKIPQAVARPTNATQVALAMALAVRCNWPLTFRGGGSSLSGQVMAEGLCLDTRRHFRGIEVLNQGRKVRVQPGATIAQVNARLAHHHTKLGPDPASSIACTIGGLVANNSSGMTCGVTANTYKTLDSMIFALPSGTVINTADQDADEQLKSSEPGLYLTLLNLRDQLRRPEVRADIERRYAIKNTMGYGMNSFIDFDEPVKILEHLMIGSEGTLGFVAEATFNTVPIHAKTATGLLIFNSLQAATDALPTLVYSGADVVELLDCRSILAVQDQASAVLPAGFQVDQQAALLVEYQGDTSEELEARTNKGAVHFGEFDLAMDPELTQDSGRRNQMWVMRNGLYTKVAGNRPVGTSPLLEDIAVPMPTLGGVCSDLQVLFDKHGYEGAVIFGHAKDGNIHFLVTEDFDGEKSMRRYENFTEDMVELILDKQGTLKAEHGTGRIMAPFVHRQYGDELYEAMWSVKRACDPTEVLNPGAVLTEDPKLYLKNIKKTNPVRPLIDSCVECGYCEPVCPSQHLTTTPRQRIVIQRAIADAEARGDREMARQLYEEEDYMVVQTCAVDGMCQTACPMKINTADLVRDLRAERRSKPVSGFWTAAAKVWGPFTGVASIGMSTVKVLPTPLVRGATGAARKLLGTDVVPTVTSELPGGGRRRSPIHCDYPDAVFMPACVGTMFGTGHENKEGAAQALRELCERTGVKLRVPDDISSLCCGTVWKSKGMRPGERIMDERLTKSLRKATDNWRLPIVCDSVSCSEGIEIALSHMGVTEATVLDATEFAVSHIIDKLPELPKVKLAVLHPTCSSTRMGVNDALMTLAKLVADEARVPDGWRCCGFAGDRGLLHEELTATATQDEAHDVAQMHADLFLSCNRTCELGLTRATGKVYVHVLEEINDRVKKLVPVRGVV